MPKPGQKERKIKSTKPTENPSEPQAVKRKLTATSPQTKVKKTKGIQNKKDGADSNIATIVINDKTCVQRSLDFSADKSNNKSKIPTGTKVRVGRSPGNPGLGPKLGQRQRSRSRHRDSGSREGRETDSG